MKVLGGPRALWVQRVVSEKGMHDQGWAIVSIDKDWHTFFSFQAK